VKLDSDFYAGIVALWVMGGEREGWNMIGMGWPSIAFHLFWNPTVGFAKQENFDWFSQQLWHALGNEFGENVNHGN
jgi:hypothetical protein